LAPKSRTKEKAGKNIRALNEKRGKKKIFLFNLLKIYIYILFKKFYLYCKFFLFHFIKKLILIHDKKKKILKIFFFLELTYKNFFLFIFK
jgi:hypothetical protein